MDVLAACLWSLYPADATHHTLITENKLLTPAAATIIIRAKHAVPFFDAQPAGHR